MQKRHEGSSQSQFRYVIFIFSHSFIHHLAGFFWTNKVNPSQLAVKWIPPRFRLYFYYCLTSVHNCDDHSHLYSLIRSSNILFSYSHSHLQKWDTFSVTLCWVSKVVLVCFGFDLLRSVIGWKNSRHFLNQNQSWLGRTHHFPVLGPSYLLRYCDRCMRLISFVSVLKHSLLF